MLKKALVTLSLAVLLTASPDGAHGSFHAPSGPAGLTVASKGREVKLFVIALDDGGRTGEKVGCNDSVVSVTRRISATRAPLHAALEELLSLPEKTGPGRRMHNALHQSNLKLKRASVRRGEAVIHLSGLLVTGGVCDAPRVQAQLERTALQFASVRRVRVYVNNKPLSDYLSERG